MATSWKMRLNPLIFLFAFSIGNGLAQQWLIVKDAITGNQFKSDEPIRISLMSNQIASLQFIASFGNSTSDKQYHARLTTQTSLKGLYRVPEYVEGWQEKSDTVYAGQPLVLMNEILIRPFNVQSVREDSFCVDAWVRFGLSAYDPVDIGRAKVLIHIDPLLYTPPFMLQEPSFSQGLTNTVHWIPVNGTSVQEAYYFDKENPTNRKKAIQRLYKRGKNDTLETTFENLLHGHTYGYFVKAVYDRDGQNIPIYSDFNYSTQDAVPPAKVESTQAVVKSDGTVWLTWKKSSDAVSGVTGYRIYKAVDTGKDLLIDAIVADPSNNEFLTWQDRIDSISYYHYRVTAVDETGNEGEGVASNEISLNGQRTIHYPPDDPIDIIPTPHNPTKHFIRGTKDTLRVALSGGENFIRFQVVRDSVRYFQMPPADGMRVFDSGWITQNSIVPDPTNSKVAMWPLDFSKQGQVDSNFVNGHIYYRRVIRKILAVYDTISLGAVVPDCFPPGDIHNLKVQAMILDPQNGNGYTRWDMRLRWEHAMDAASGLKGYRIYRRIMKRDSTFKEIQFPKLLVTNQFSDSIRIPSDSEVYNPMVAYRILGEDNVGNLRPIEKTYWEIRERALGCPEWTFDFSDRFTRRAGQDTVFTQKDSVGILIRRFDVSMIYRYVVEVNGTETIYENKGSDKLLIRLSDKEVTRIRFRIFYPGERSSVWTVDRWAVRALKKRVDQITAWNDSTYWGGHIYLRWTRPSLDLKQYNIWRIRQNRDSVLIGVSNIKSDTVVWTDLYDVDELTGKTGEGLPVYEWLQYRIQTINVFDETGGYSVPVSVFSNRPPQIVSSSILAENNRIVIQIRWRRPYPNAIRKNVTSIVRVSEDGFDKLVAVDFVTDDDSTYTYRNAVPGKNYIFQVKEVLNDDPFKRSSSWSKPFTKSLRMIRMDVQPQPRGDMFIVWDRSTVDTLRIRDYILQRTSKRDTIKWIYPNTQSQKMDSSKGLVHGQAYRYSLFAMDSLNQVLAANVKMDTCDKGAAFIPAVVPFTMKYFRTNAIDVSWEWKTVSGRSTALTTRGADLCVFQISVSKNFPTDTAQTRTIGPFRADPLKRSLSVTIPKLGNRENNRVYIRITAKDAWNNPQQQIWSTDFYGLVEAVFDTIQPKTVTDLAIASLTAYYKKSDAVTVGLKWTSTGIENSGEVVDPLLPNVSRYRIIRFQNGNEMTIKDLPVHPKNIQYSVQDTISNTAAKWRIVSIDSAGNSASSGWLETPVIVPTPPPPKPVQFRDCTILPVSLSNARIEYYVEIAMRPDHFQLAYEIDPGSISDRLISRSGWFVGTQFASTTGWGKIETDTTYFRVKARAGLWESGWSQTAIYVKTSEPPGQRQQENGLDVPTEFMISQNYPNPFNTETRISIQMPENGSVEVQLFNVTGSRIRHWAKENKPMGRHVIVWDATEESGQTVSSGIYIAVVSIQSEKGTVFHKRMKMMLIK